MKFHGTMKVNEQGHLEIGGCDTVDLAREFGTPLYVMDEVLMREICRQYKSAFVEKYGNAEVIYASKAFLTKAICCLMQEEGLGLDVVSGGEIYTALQANFPPERMYFHGNNKSASELTMALEAGVGRIVVDNFYEMEMLDRLAGEMGKKAEILLRITPGVEAHTHEYIKTGQIDSKFGFTLPNGQALEAVKAALKKENLVLHGLHCHIGSQIFEMDSYAYTARVMMDFIKEIQKTTGWTAGELNLGGGFGIYYADGDEPATITDYADAVFAALREKAEEHDLPVPKVIVEPGRSIAGPAGSTLYTVGSIKEIPGVRKYVAVDGGMTDNIRPALYQARYEAIIANKADQPPAEVVSITGKCCESGDMLAWDVPLQPAEPGDILAMFCTGAYGYTMSSNYNRLGRPAAVLVANGQADLILQRETYEDLVRNDVIPARFRK
ncbi:diaminopimelate decarboxylase [Calderihabitans maritimus]|uniref:Diaminopimelate decarboxylase n=1 Tax=Calderihabitans maritimus TaxID=1246530 RepID=A0A1Z5HPN3_9FIRM|nr:diaminopimelate decarboxylase [Calderihabitans maritimus]GAW91398.1 diaminopimelate decarboxylase [Calderihabitans maritimus]